MSLASRDRRGPPCACPIPSTVWDEKRGGKCGGELVYKGMYDRNLKLVFETIGEAIAKEDTLSFLGFGTFKTTIRKATKVKTPKGVIVDVPEKRVLKFSVGSDLKEKAANKK